ncbi:hypothetical protein QP932_10670 [Corynebacterium freneyi]|uniref:hypothetical protein n=1 Tax=Corynebacterium freneyi TaxID=134034 RepID=UPI00255039D2|nr:hypothetical protein [Corynebacterium freneyi]MDK8768954.1 hypothetical protein [Corynebacterium freneyi]
MGKVAGLAVIGIVVVIGVFAVINAVGSGGGGEAVRTVVREAPDKDDGKDKDKDREPREPGSVEGARVTWRGSLVDEYGLDGRQMDAVFERVRECLPVERAQFLELCLQGREADWYDEGGYDDVDVDVSEAEK